MNNTLAPTPLTPGAHFSILAPNVTYPLGYYGKQVNDTREQFDNLGAPETPKTGESSSKQVNEPNSRLFLGIKQEHQNPSNQSYDADDAEQSFNIYCQ